MDQTVTFKGDHLSALTLEANKQREADEFCDVYFLVENERISAHRCILASYSEAFKRMFRCQLREKNPNEIDVKALTAQTLLTLITFIYTATITLKWENVYDLYTAAQHLQMTQICEFCIQFLKDKVSTRKSIEVYSFCIKNKINCLITTIENLISNNFQAVVELPCFKELCCKEMLLILSLKEKNISSDECVFTAGIEWIKHNLEKRKQHLDSCFRLVDLGNLDNAFLKTVVSKEKLIMRSNCVGLLSEEIFQRLNIGKSCSTPIQICIAGGSWSGNTNQSFAIYCKITKKWKVRQSTSYPRYGATGCVINNVFYVVGGIDSPRQVESYKFHCMEPKWYNEACTLYDRWQSASASLKERVYVAGGMIQDTASDSVEYYATHMNEWFEAPAMLQARRYHVMVSSDGLLYAFGGIGKLNEDLASAEVFDERLQMWIHLPPMEAARSGLAAAVVDNKIYVIGGKNLRSVECYDIIEGKWSGVASMSCARHGACACSIGSKVYVVGGEGDVKSETTIEVYDTRNNTWSIEYEMPSPRVFSCVASIKP